MKKKMLLGGVGLFLILTVGLTFVIGQENGKNGEKFKRTSAEERLAELLDDPIVKEEYTSEEMVDSDTKGEELKENPLMPVSKDNIKLLSERVGYIKDDKVSLWVTLGNINNVEMRSYTGDTLLNGVRYKEEFITSNSVNDLLQVKNSKDSKAVADRVFLILDNSNLYIDYGVHSEEEAIKINSKYKVVSSNGLKVDLMLEYSMGYKSKQDTKGYKYLEELSLTSNAKEKQKYNLKIYTKSNVKPNGLGTLLYDGNKVLYNREKFNITLKDILKHTKYDESKLVWVLKVASAKDSYKVEETELIIEVK